MKRWPLVKAFMYSRVMHRSAEDDRTDESDGDVSMDWRRDLIELRASEKRSCRR